MLSSSSSSFIVLKVFEGRHTMTVHVWPSNMCKPYSILPHPHLQQQEQEIVPQIGYYCPKFYSSFRENFGRQTFCASIAFWWNETLSSLSSHYHPTRPSVLSWRESCCCSKAKQWANNAHNVYQLFSLIYLEQMFESTRTIEKSNTQLQQCGAAYKHECSCVRVWCLFAEYYSLRNVKSKNSLFERSKLFTQTCDKKESHARNSKMSSNNHTAAATATTTPYCTLHWVCGHKAHSACPNIHTQKCPGIEINALVG